MESFLKLVATDLYNRTQGDLAHTAVVFLTNAPVCFLMSIWRNSRTHQFGHRLM